MIENIPRSVLRCITASAKDITDSVRETGGVPNAEIKVFAANIEKFMLGMVGGVFPNTKGTWVDKSASSAWVNKTAATEPPVADQAAVEVKKEREIIRSWVAKNATKEMYESLIGGVDSLANVLKQQHDNDDKGEFSKQYPDLAASLQGGEAPIEAMEEPAKADTPAMPAPAATGDAEIPGELQALLDDKMGEVGGDLAEPEEPAGDSKAPEETAEGYTGGMFDKPRKGPAPAGETTPKRQNMDEFNTPVQELAKKKPEAATGHKI
jgi:hypothetical protein